MSSVGGNSGMKVPGQESFISGTMNLVAQEVIKEKKKDLKTKTKKFFKKVGYAFKHAGESIVEIKNIAKIGRAHV